MGNTVKTSRLPAKQRWRLKIFVVHNNLLPTIYSAGDDRLRVKSLPEDARVIAVSPHISFHDDLLGFKVESREFPEVPFGGEIPRVDVTAADIESESGGGAGSHHRRPVMRGYVIAQGF